MARIHHIRWGDTPSARAVRFGARVKALAEAEAHPCAEAGDFGAITYRINGGYDGASSREAYDHRALAALA